MTFVILAHIFAAPRVSKLLYAEVEKEEKKLRDGFGSDLKRKHGISKKKLPSIKAYYTVELNFYLFIIPVLLFLEIDAQFVAFAAERSLLEANKILHDAKRVMLIFILHSLLYFYFIL